MQTQQTELYIENIRSGILVEGMIGEEYVEVRYKYILNHPDTLKGVFHVTGLTPTIARAYGSLKSLQIESDNGNWKSRGRRKITDEMYQLIGKVEEFLCNNNFVIIE